MEQYLPKSALVAEIQRRIKEHKRYANSNRNNMIEEDVAILSFINTLEVKEVDLEKEIQDIFQKYKNGYNGLVICNKTDFSLIAKYFFELGLKAQKGEEV